MRTGAVVSSTVNFVEEFGFASIPSMSACLPGNFSPAGCRVESGLPVQACQALTPQLDAGPRTNPTRHSVGRHSGLLDLVWTHGTYVNACPAALVTGIVRIDG